MEGKARNMLNGLNITVLYPRLCLGGADRCCLALATWLQSEKAHVHIVSWESPVPEIYEDSSAVSIHSLDLGKRKHGALRDNIHRIRTLRAKIKDLQPDLIISFLPEMNIIGILACIGLPVPIIVSDQCHPHYAPKPRIWRFLRTLSYPLVNGFALQTYQERALLPRSFRARSEVVQNFLPTLSRKNVESAGSKVRCLCASRLVAQKGIPHIVEHFLQICERSSRGNEELHIFGDGPDRQKIEDLLAQSRFAHSVTLHGESSTVLARFTDFDILFFHSYFEGLSNTLIEALVAGLAVVSTDAPLGTSELLWDKKNALLIHGKDETAFRQAMEQVLQNDELRKKLQGHAPERFTDQYWIKSEKAWSRLIEKVLQQHRQAHD